MLILCSGSSTVYAMYPNVFLFLLLSITFVACQHRPSSPPAADSSVAGGEKPPGRFNNLTVEISDLSSFESLVADYESKDRVIWQKPDRVISLLGDLSGKTVADIGAGTGYFAFRLVPVAAKVIAVDIDPRFIHFMDSIKVRLTPVYQRRFETRLARPDNPMLLPEEVDAVIIVNTYGYLSHRPTYLKTLWEGMKPQAKLLIIDFKKTRLPIGPPDEYKVALSEVVKEVESVGFQLTTVDQETLEYQYIVVAQKSPPTHK